MFVHFPLDVNLILRPTEPLSDWRWNFASFTMMNSEILGCTVLGGTSGRAETSSRNLPQWLAPGEAGIQNLA